MLQRVHCADEILIVDGHPLFRSALGEIVKAIAPFRTVLHAATLGEAKLTLSQRPAVQTVLLDLELRDRKGLTGFFELSAHFPLVPIVIISGMDDQATVQKGLTLGAFGFISKRRTAIEIRNALEALLCGDTLEPTKLPNCDAHPGVKHFAALKPAEAKVLLGICRGQRNQDIAAEMGLGEDSVKKYVTEVMRKIGVSTRLQAAIAARVLAAPQAASE